MTKSIILLILAFLLMLTSCSTPIAEPTPTPTPTAASTIAPTPELTPEPTPDTAALEKFDMAPDIIGLEKEIREKDGIWKVVYTYLEENNYGGAAGEYAGEYKKEVMVTDPETGETEEVGGLALKPDVIKWWIDLMKPDDRFTYSNGSFTCAIPLDISEMKGDNISISYVVSDNNSDRFSKIKFDFDGTLPIICPALGKEEVDSNYILYKEGDDFVLIEELVKNYTSSESKEVLYSWNERWGEMSLDLDLVTRYINFIGEFESDISIPEGSRQVDFGKFVYGEEMCRAFSGLICRGYMATTINWLNDCLKIKDTLVFLCGNDS